MNKSLSAARKKNLLQTAYFKVAGFIELLAKIEQKVTVAGKSQNTLKSHAFTWQN